MSRSCRAAGFSLGQSNGLVHLPASPTLTSPLPPHPDCAVCLSDLSHPLRHLLPSPPHVFTPSRVNTAGAPWQRCSLPRGDVDGGHSPRWGGVEGGLFLRLLFMENIFEVVSSGEGRSDAFDAEPDGIFYVSTGVSNARRCLARPLKPRLQPQTQTRSGWLLLHNG